MIPTAALGVNLDETTGRIVVCYLDEDRQKVIVDVTTIVDEVARYVFTHRIASVRSVPMEDGLVASNRYVN